MGRSADTYRWTYFLNLQRKWNERLPDFTRGPKDSIFPSCLASTADKQLTGNPLGSDINRQSQVPLIQTHTACKLALINLKPRGSTRNEMFLEGADTVNESVGYAVSLITQTILMPRADLKVPLPFLGRPPPPPSPLAISGKERSPSGKDQRPPTPSADREAVSLMVQGHIAAVERKGHSVPSVHSFLLC